MSLRPGLHRRVDRRQELDFIAGSLQRKLVIPLRGGKLGLRRLE
jgi:hypothetical protein